MIYTTNVENPKSLPAFFCGEGAGMHIEVGKKLISAIALHSEILIHGHSEAL